MSVFKNIRGIFGNILQLGGVLGPLFKNNAGVIEAKNFDDSALAIMRAATPVGDTDVVTKLYADSLSKPIRILRQADCSSSIPNNTAVRGFVVVSTAGSGTNIGDILYDNGLNDASPMAILTAVEGRCIAVTDALGGGAVTFDPDSIYIWDADGSAWVKIGDIGSVTGAVRMIRTILDNTASQDSVATVPANARVIQTDLEITTPYSGGSTIEIGSTGTSDLLMETTENTPQAAHTYSKEQDTGWGGAAGVVRATVGGSPGAGAGVMRIFYSVANG